MAEQGSLGQKIKDWIWGNDPKGTPKKKKKKKVALGGTNVNQRKQLEKLEY